MGKKTEEVKEDYSYSEPSYEHTGNCKGEFVIEFIDKAGKHNHCPECGAWVTS